MKKIIMAANISDKQRI